MAAVTIPGVDLATVVAGLDAATAELNTENFAGVDEQDQHTYSVIITQCVNAIAVAKELVQLKIA